MAHPGKAGVLVQKHQGVHIPVGQAVVHGEVGPLVPFQDAQPALVLAQVHAEPQLVAVFPDDAHALLGEAVCGAQHPLHLPLAALLCQKGRPGHAADPNPVLHRQHRVHPALGDLGRGEGEDFLAAFRVGADAVVVAAPDKAVEALPDLRGVDQGDAVVDHLQRLPGLPVDGAQAVPHMPVDVQALDADFYAFSGHKVYGPTGVGVLYGKENWLDKLPPYQGGGEMIGSVSFERTTYNELPYKFEAGTPDYVGTTALACALRYVSAIGMDAIGNWEHELTQYALRRFEEIGDIRVFGNAAERGGVLSFQVGNIHHFDLGTLLDRLGIAVRTGHHCAQPLMQRLGIEGTARASFGLYNTKEEVDALIAGIERVRKMF